MTIKQAAEEQNDLTLFYTTTYDVWDAEKITGCVCDPGFTGYDCSLRQCPSGKDTLSASYGNEIQILECTCPTTCSGHFYLKFRSEYVQLSPTDTAAELKAKLETLESIPAVDVTLNGGSTVCDNDGVSTEIEFRNNPGNQPNIIPINMDSLTTTSGLVSLSIVSSGGVGTQGGTSQDGIAPIEECSGRGYCITQFGFCLCQQTGVAITGGYFEGSDGEGGQGGRGDCGYYSLAPTGCPYADGGSGTPTECASNGICNAGSFTCTCNAGYAGHACSLLECPTGPAWFSEATAANTAHPDTECSNNGICDRSTGTCICRDGFEGDACEKLACPGYESGTPCNGHGTCMTIQQLATLSEDNGVLRGVTYGLTPTEHTWDFDYVHGCYCDSGYFHGPFAYDFSDFTGSHDCTLLTCPFGDNPQTVGQVNEVQTITCIASSGTFTVTFRQEITPDIPHNVDLATFKTFLEELNTIHQMDSVVFSGGSTTEACSPGAGTTIALGFKVPGDLPLIEIDDSQLGGATVSIEETVKGTTEFLECSGQGICDRSSGTCTCFEGYTSSDGSGDGGTVGSRGDCGAMYIFATSQTKI